MRSRPDVKVFLDPGMVVPGEKLVAETILTSKSETPIDLVEMRLKGLLRTAAGAGNSRRYHEQVVYDRVWKDDAKRTLGEGEHKFRVEFEFANNAPPTYAGADASITYELHVHVSIPWWPDRRKSFIVPVGLFPYGPGPDPQPAVFATSTQGPRGGVPFMEVALDATSVGVGDVVSGSVSLQNFGDKSVRGVDLCFVEIESVTLPYPTVRERGRYRLRVFDGRPAEGEPIPFRVRLPERATPTFAAGPISVRTAVELRADIAWGSDIVVNVPVRVAPAKGDGAGRGRVAPVGRERMRRVWEAAAQRIAGFVVDAEGDGIHGMRGGTRIRIAGDHRHGDYWLVGELSFPSLGLDVDIGERKWSDALAVDVVKTGHEKIDGRLVVHAREHAQAKPFADELLPALMAFEEVKGDDEKLVLATRGSVHASDRVEAFVGTVLTAADALESARSRIAPPALFAAHVPAWRAFAESIFGRLDVGRMWIREGRIGTDTVELGCTWERRGVLLGATLRVAIDPPLATPPPSPDDPSVSPAAREAWKALCDRAKSVTVRPEVVVVELATTAPLTDPSAAMPVLELAVALRRSLVGAVVAGPFR